MNIFKMIYNKVVSIFRVKYYMGVRLGNFDPLQLIFGILDSLLRNKAITVDQAKEIIRSALPPEMPTEEKNRIVDAMVIENDNQS